MGAVYATVAYYIKEYENMLMINIAKRTVVPRGQLSPIFLPPEPVYEPV